MTISCSDFSSDHARMVVESSLYWRKQTQNFVAGAVFGEVGG